MQRPGRKTGPFSLGKPGYLYNMKQFEITVQLMSGSITVEITANAEASENQLFDLALVEITNQLNCSKLAEVRGL